MRGLSATSAQLCQLYNNNNNYYYYFYTRLTASFPGQPG